MPARIWQRGKNIVANENAQIENIDRINKEVKATVYGTYAYEVVIREKSGSMDLCDCPYFAENGFCKHIAAVIELLKEQHRPLEHLFMNGEFDEDENGFADQDETIHFFHNRETRMAQESGNLFLDELKLPTKQYFQLPSKDESEKITIEVNLIIAEVSESYDSFKNRFFVNLRVGAEGENKLYIVKDIDDFLYDYENGLNYQTGGKREFQVGKQYFSESEQEFLDYLVLVNNNDIIYNNEFDKAKYFMLPINSAVQALALCTKLPQLNFQPGEDGPIYHSIQQKQFEANDGLLVGTVKSVSDGYDLTLKSKFDVYVEDNSELIKGNIVYQVSLSKMKMIIQIINNYNSTATEWIREQRRQGENAPKVALHFPIGSESDLSNFITSFKNIGIISAPEQLSASQVTPTFDISEADDKLELQLGYKYDDVDDSDQQEPIKRNLAKEKQARSYLERLQFYSMNRDNHFTKQFSEAEDLYEFFVRELPNLRQNGIVTISDELNDLLLDAKALNPTVNVSETDGFLAVKFSFDGINEQEVDGILAQLEDVNRPYIERPDGSIIVLDESFNKVANALVKIRQQGKVKNGQVKLHASQALSIQSALGGSAQFDQKFEQMTQNLAHPEGFEYANDHPVQAQLRPYQKLGIQWLEMLDSYHFGGILADEMGLGKTVQMIAFLINHLEAGKTNLIVSPASLIYNWQAEFNKFAPEVNTTVVDGTKEKRQELINDTQTNILITSYNSARSDIEEYEQSDLNYLVLDEAQFVKNSSTKTSQSLRKLNPKNTFALSGTPIENRVEELWSIFEIVMPGLLPSKKAFKKLTPEEVSIRVKPFIMRREKEAVLKELPEKVESNLYNELTKEQKTVYLAQLKQMQVKVRGMSGDTFVKNKLEILAGLTRLRQICDTPALYLDDYKAESGKLEQLNEILQQAEDSDRHVLIFSQFTGMLDIIEAKLKQQGLDTFMIQGNTKPKDRLEMVNKFNAGEKNIFLISLKAGGTGLNLTGAAMVVLVDLWWNPAVEDQATARAHRIGQKKKVDVFRLITKGTIEEQIYKLQEKKRNFVDQVLSGTENKGTLTEEEVRVILGI
ncbi:hypothetical protein IV59_GL001937 [Paucilactobacillus hokkaidonensis]|nr:hypothetical protein IV59_GL001937 [Paucilactobacillus hokkaidonensis]